MKSDKFLITAELFPPKGVDIPSFLRRADCLTDIDVVNATDNQRASMRVGSLAMSRVLVDRGIEPVVQIAARIKTEHLIKTARLLETSVDLAGKKLFGNPKFCVEAVVNPSARPSDLQALPGVNIPQKIQDRINCASNPLDEGIKICSEIIRDLRSFTDGVHIMAIGIEEYILKIIKNSS